MAEGEQREEDDEVKRERSKRTGMRKRVKKREKGDAVSEGNGE